MPPHSSNYCQLLDVSCFSPLKRAYGSLVQKGMQHGFNHMDKLDFLEAYPDAQKQAFASDTIKKGFRATGLVPFNPEEVLGYFTIQLKTPTPPGSQSTNSAPKTPGNPQQLERQASRFKNMLKQHTPPPLSVLEMWLDKMIKGHGKALNEAIIVQHELKGIQASHKKHLHKRKQSRKQIATAEGLSIQEGQSILQDRNQPDEAVPTASADQHLKQNTTLYGHHHDAVIAILEDVKGVNVLIAIVISFYIEMHFLGFKIGRSMLEGAPLVREYVIH